MLDLDDAVYVPGAWVAVSAANGCLLVDLAAADPVVRRCWKLLSEDAGADAILDALAAGGIATAPPFALVVRTGAGHRAVVRHPASLVVHAEGRDQVVIEASADTSWSDRVLAETVLDAVSLSGPAADASVELPMGAGVTTASVVHLRAGSPIALQAETPVARPVPFPRDAATVESAVPPEPVRPAPIRPASQPAVTKVEPHDPPAAPPVTDVPEDDDGDSYDHLFGASTQRPIAPPVAHPPPSRLSEPAAPPMPVSSHTAGWHTEAPVVRDVPVAAPAPPEGLIEGVPWASADAESPTKAFAVPEVPAVVEALPDAETVTVPAASSGSSDYGATVNRAQLRADAQATAGPTVLAGRCPNDHLSPPHADRCRVCRAPMPDQEAFEIGRPVLGVLRLQSGDLVTLDRGVLLGRSPDVPTGLDRPHVLRLKSPDNDISRNHAEVVLDGWNVSVRDLGSTNGTVVQLPGRAPVRLRENEPALLENGAVVTLADEVTLVFEVQQ